MALTLHEDSKCSGCGHYADEAWDPDADGFYEVDDSLECAACGARETHLKNEKNREPGQLLRVYDARVEGFKPTKRSVPDTAMTRPAPPRTREETVG